MTAPELIELIEGAGGTLAVKGDKLHCTLPRRAAHLIPALRTQKPAVIEILKRRDASIPWPGYHGGRPFVCQKCGVHFDTSAGIAKHQVDGCEHEALKAAEVTGNLRACPACGSFAMYREKDGKMTCQTCGFRL